MIIYKTFAALSNVDTMSALSFNRILSRANFICKHSYSWLGPEEHPGEDELDEIFNDPIFANDGGGNSGSIFDIPEYMSRRLAARKEADYIGRRRPCDDFLHFADGFSEIHAGLKIGKYRMVKFNAAHLKPGCYFVEQGVVGYLAASCHKTGCGAYRRRTSRAL